MNKLNEVAVLENMMEYNQRLGHLEGLVEGLMAQQRELIIQLEELRGERSQLLGLLKTQTDHTHRLLRAKEVLLESAGRVAIARLSS